MSVFATAEMSRKMAEAKAELRYWADNYQRFYAEYPEEFVAVRDDEVVAHDPDFWQLIEDLEGLGLAIRDDVIINFISAVPLNL
jgi:hypothetical protein